MKRNLLTLSLIITTLVLSCSDDDSKKDSSPTFKKEDFYGTWEENGSETSGCTKVIKIDATKYYFGSKCGADFTFDNGATYTYEDNQFSFSSSGYWRFKIMSRTTTTFKTQRYIETADLGEYNYTKL
jgi:hypothetical protein